MSRFAKGRVQENGVQAIAPKVTAVREFPSPFGPSGRTPVYIDKLNVGFIWPISHYYG